MRHGFFLALPALLMLTLAVGPAGAQTGAQEAPAPGAREIKVSSSNRLSVRLQDAYFGDVMEDIGSQAGFEVRVGSGIYEKKVSTSFTDMELERGIYRLLSLISQKTFFIHYAPDGSISRVDIFTPGTGGSTREAGPGRTPAAGPTAPTPAVRLPRQPMGRFNQGVPLTEAPAAGQQPAAEQPLETEQGGVEFVGDEAPGMGQDEGVGEAPAPEPMGDPGLGVEGEEGSHEAPYIPPTRVPAYIPRNSE